MLRDAYWWTVHVVYGDVDILCGVRRLDDLTKVHVLPHRMKCEGSESNILVYVDKREV